MNGDYSFEDIQRQLEDLFGYPKGAFDPRTKFFEDQARINKALGHVTLLLQDIMSPQQIKDKIEADSLRFTGWPPLNAFKNMPQVKLPFTDHDGKRR
jgi:hypothetical protein